LSKVASTYALDYYKIDSEDTIEKTVGKILATHSPVICEVVVDPAQNFVPKSSTKLLANGKMSSAPLQDMYPFLPEKEIKGNVYR
jgi:acetolactate synthase-1/2/3 large subunit